MSSSIGCGPVGVVATVIIIIPKDSELHFQDRSTQNFLPVHDCAVTYITCQPILTEKSGFHATGVVLAYEDSAPSRWHRSLIWTTAS